MAQENSLKVHCTIVFIFQNLEMFLFLFNSHVSADRSAPLV